VESGVGETRHHHPAVNGYIQRSPNFFEVLQAASTAHGSNHAVPNQNRTVLDETDIAKVCAASSAAWTSQR